MPGELKIIVDFYDFMVYLIQRIERFPRHHRYSLGIAMESRLQQILALLLRGRYSSERTACLKDANIELEVLRFQLRLAKYLRSLPVKSRPRDHAAPGNWRPVRWPDPAAGRPSMKRHGGLWDRLISWEHLVLAERKAQRGRPSAWRG